MEIKCIKLLTIVEEIVINCHENSSSKNILHNT